MSNNGYNFTARVRRVLATAREESSALHHEYVGTEHLLLGLLSEGEGVACAVLHTLNADYDDIRRDVLEHVKKGSSTNATSPDLPYTSRAKKVLELSMSEARELNHSYVGTEHLLLGILREEKGIAAQVLTNNGIIISKVRAETLRLLGSPDATVRRSLDAWESPNVDTSRSPYKLSAVFVEMHFDNGTTLRKEFANAAWAIKYLENM
ncbi:MAG: Clp protease N-terminal domain-containing protein [Gemmatimonas sp.]